MAKDPRDILHGIRLTDLERGATVVLHSGDEDYLEEVLQANEEAGGPSAATELHRLASKGAIKGWDTPMPERRPARQNEVRATAEQAQVLDVAATKAAPTKPKVKPVEAKTE